eukprot:SAG31_NODE_7214_length_1753_cov_1.617896_1_plen_109_part_00
MIHYDILGVLTLADLLSGAQHRGAGPNVGHLDPTDALAADYAANGSIIAKGLVLDFETGAPQIRCADHVPRARIDESSSCPQGSIGINWDQLGSIGINWDQLGSIAIN